MLAHVQQSSQNVVGVVAHYPKYLRTPRHNSQVDFRTRFESIITIIELLKFHNATRRYNS